MAPGNRELPVEAIAALERGDKIEAIKIVREFYGAGLAEAKELVEHYRAPAVPFTGALPSDAILALTHGKKIDAIRIVRERHGMGLKEAKDAVEAYIATQPGLASQFPAVGGGFLPWLIFIGVAVLGLYLAFR